MLLRIILLLFAYFLLAAHFLRSGNIILMVLCFILPFLLLIKKQWALITLQISLYVGAWIWVRTAIIIIHDRITLGASWIKAAIIIGLVAFLTLLAGLLLNSTVIRDRFTSNIIKKEQN
ncbi:MAG: hypothetical protein ACMUIU_15725 [bacterium]